MVFHISQRRSRRRRSGKFKGCDDHNEFMSRIRKTCYYGKMPSTLRLSLPLSEIAAEAFSEMKIGKTLERLSLDEAAEMSRVACVSPCSLVLAVLYLEQLKTCNPSYLDTVNPSDLFIVSLMVGAKVVNDDDGVVTNGWWAEKTGISLEDINRLEVDFIQALNWELFVDESRFWHALRQLEQTIALRQASTRGWFSYTDLDVLSESADGLALAQTIFTVSAVCLASYAAGMITITGSTCLAAHLVASGFYERAIALATLHSLAQPSFSSSSPNLPTNSNVEWIACRPPSPLFILNHSNEAPSSSRDVVSHLPAFDSELNDSDTSFEGLSRFLESKTERRAMLPFVRNFFDFTVKYLDYSPPLITWKS